MEPKNRPVGAALIIWYALVILLALAGLVGLALAFIPYPALKSFFDALAADGSFERLTPALHQSMRLPGGIGGGLLLLAAGLAAWQAGASRRLVAAGLHWLRRALANLAGDFSRLAAGAVRAAPPAWEWALLLLILAVGVAARLVFIQRAVEYDEAYTYVEFARHPVRQIISDYHHPNNHVLHTLLVHLSTRLFGGGLWAVRLPACAAGVLILPAVYALGRRLYHPWAGLAAAGLLAVTPAMVSYSVNARGYTLLTLCAVLLFLLADSARARKNRAAWALMALVTALGFYTIPTMLYPFGILAAWLFLSGVLGDIDAAYGGWKGWMTYLIVYGAAAGLLSMLLYLPIFRVKGLWNVFNHDPIVQSLTMHDFTTTLAQRLTGILGEWIPGGLAGWLGAVFLIGLALSVLLQRKASRSRVNIPLAGLLFVVPALLVQRPLLLPRVWFFLLPLLALCAVAGWLALAGRLPWRGASSAAAALALALALLGGGRWLAAAWQDPARVYHSAPDGAAQVSQYLRDHLGDGDLVVVTQLYDARFWYYFDLYQIPQRHIRDVKRQHFTRVLVIAAAFEDLTPAEIAYRFGPDPVFLRIETLQEIYRAGSYTVYQIAPYQERVDQAFDAPEK